LVKKIGTGRATRYTLNEDSVLAGEIVRLFESEREAAEPGWAREHGRREHGRQEHGRRELRPALGRNGGGDGKRTRGNGAAEEARSKGNGNGAGSTIHSLPAEETPHLNLDPANPRIHSALATLLEEELSLLRRARERVLDKLKDRHPGNGHDLWE